jgi:hypothetical protein
MTDAVRGSAREIVLVIRTKRHRDNRDIAREQPWTLPLPAYRN